MAALAVVSDYITEARTLLQDTVAPYRYLDTELVTALNMALLEARKVRPDLFIGLNAVQSFTANDSTAVTIPEQYKNYLVFYICGNAQLRDEESTQDSRAMAFFGMFKSGMLGA